MNIVGFIVRRLLLAILVLLGVVTITFILAHSIGGNPVYAWLGRDASAHPQLVQIYTKEYHLDSPLYVQYYYYLDGLLHGNLGLSPAKEFEPVSDVIAQTFPYTFQIAFFAILISLILGISLGVIASRFHHGPVDKSIRGFYLAGISSPSFFIALVLIIVFCSPLIFRPALLPSGGAAAITLATPKPVTHIPMLDSLLEGNYPYFFSSLQHVILPSVSLALGTFGVVVRILRSSMLDVMRSNYIRTARAKGLKENTVFFKHGLRNAMISVVTLSSLIVTWLITGTIFVENIFSYPGMGQYVFQALIVQDYPGILATTLVFAIIIILANLVADILYVVVDPQIRLG